MKVMLLGPFHNPLIYRLRKNLIQNGIEVISVSYDVDDNQENDIYSLGPLKGLRSFFFSNKLRQLIREYNPDVVHAHVSNHYGLLTLSIRRSIPVLLTLWGSDVMSVSKQKNVFKKKLLQSLNLLSYLRANAIHSSSVHVINELESLTGRLKNMNKEKYSFYWGAPLERLEGRDLEKQSNKLKEEVCASLFEGRKLIVFPRGVNKIYNPNLVVSIINTWGEVNPERSLVVFKAFSSESAWDKFKSGITNANCCFVERLLDDNELSSIYSSSLAHVSIPFSDNLGGGVVEPLQLGSFPILSKIEPYVHFSEDTSCYIMQRTEEEHIVPMINFIENGGAILSKVSDGLSNPGMKFSNIYCDIKND